MVYQVDLAPAAQRQLRKLESQTRERILTRIQALARHPRPAGVETLEASEGLYRLRVGDYRVIYQVEDEVLLVLVVRVGHRREVYLRPTRRTKLKPRKD